MVDPTPLFEERPPAPEGWPVCRVCGCWEYAACSDDCGECWWVDDDLCSHCVESEDPLDGHFASSVWHVRLTLWRWRLDISVWAVETSANPESPRGYELAFNVWRMPHG